MIGGPSTPATRLERFRAWVESFTAALEAGDPDAAVRLFAIECSLQAGPWAAELRGRPEIRSHLAERLAAMPGLDTRAEILGVGSVYGVAHWSLAWGSRGAGERADGILLVALDPMGRCSAIREWTLEEPLPC